MTLSIPIDATCHITLRLRNTKLIQTSSCRSDHASMPRGSNTHSQRIRDQQMQIETSSRRRSMTIQDMLNPAGEDDGQSIATQSSSSSSEEERQPSESHDQRIVSRGGGERSGRSAPRPHISHRSGASISRRPNGSRRPSQSPSSWPEGRRPFFPPYSQEQIHFIW